MKAGDQLDQSSIVKRCQEGDSEAFEALYHLHSQQALKTAYLLHGRKGIAEDIVQEAFIQCFRGIKKLQRIEAFNTWFYLILIRVGWRVSSKNQNMFPLDIPEQTSEGLIHDLNQNNNLNPEEFLENQERIRIVRRAVKKLKPPLKSAIILYYFNHLSIPEIARVLGCFQGTVKSRLHNAKKLLEAELRVDFAEESPVTYSRKECKSNV